MRLVVLAASVLLVAPVAPAFALDCPTAQAKAQPGILKETPAQMAQVGKTLAAGDTFNAIASVAADLHIRYPGVEKAELVNYLVTAYCPTVAADNRLSEAQKKSAVDSFAAQVMRQVY
jgi:hypothetical protein